MAAPPSATSAIAGFHLFPFGGLRKAGLWLREFKRVLPQRRDPEGLHL